MEYANGFAKRLAENGFRLVLLGEKSKIPLTPKWTTAARCAWIDENPGHLNWGVVGGDTDREDGRRLVVIDVDVKPGKTGDEELQALIDKYGDPPPTYRVRSWSGGLHLYFLTDVQSNSFRKTMRSEKFPRSSIDIQGPGKQVVAPGSYVEEVVQRGDGTGVKSGTYTEDRESPLFREIEEMADISQWFGDDTATLLLSTGPTIVREPYRMPDSIEEGKNSHTECLRLAGMLNARYGLVGQVLTDKLYEILVDKKDLGTYSGSLDKEWLSQFSEFVSRRFMFHTVDDLVIAEFVVFHSHVGPEIRYVANHGFYVWDGSIWQFAHEDSYVYEAMSSLARALQAAIAKSEWEHSNQEERGRYEERYDIVRTKDGAYIEGKGEPDVALMQAVRKKLSNTHSRRSILSSLKENAHSLGIAEDAKNFNANPNLLVCKNGTIEFDGKGGFVFRENRKEDLMTTRLNVDYSPNAVCPTFIRTMQMNIVKQKGGRGAPYSLTASNAETDHDTLAWLQKWLGYCITGQVGEHKMVMFYGHGRNGKSLLIETLSDIMGVDEYYTQLDAWILDSKSGKNKDPVKLKLQGARMAVIHEAPAYQLDESELKSLIGGDMVTARGLYQKNVITFSATHKLMYVSNNKPQIRSAGVSIWDKIVLIPFRRYVGDFERDGQLNLKLRKELPGILNWLIEGACQWYKLTASGGNLSLCLSKVLEKEREEYKEEEIPLKTFVADVLYAKSAGVVKGSHLYNTYLQWEESRQTHLSHVLGQKRFYKTLGELGIDVHKDNKNAQCIYGYVMKPLDELQEILESSPRHTMAYAGVDF